MSKFKVGILIVFGLFIVIGIIVFASTNSNQNIVRANLTIWGTLPDSNFGTFIKETQYDKDQNIIVNYLRKDPETFDTELAEALADGRGPDMILLPQDMIFRHRNKITVIPYKSFTEREYKDSFIEASEVYLTKEGIMAIPIVVDPMVMYWNRDIFKENSLTLPPKHWDEFLTLSPRINRKDQSGNFTKSAIAFGEWRNITNAKDILSNLLLQSGINIVTQGEYRYSDLSSSESSDRNIAPGNSAISFYTEFADPTSPIYSWNRSLPSSVNYFLSGNLATYMGFASDLSKLRERNPNLNFDVTYIPSIRNTKKPTVYAKVYGLSIIKQSLNQPTSLYVMRLLTSDQSIQNLVNHLNLPPIKRNLLTDIPTDAYKSVFYKSAIITKTWLDPERKLSNGIFQTMIESVTSGRLKINDALERANQELDALVKQ